MPGRPHAERLKFDLDSVRAELTQEITALKPGDLDWVPAEGMKSFRSLLLEIGTMERICLAYARDQKTLDWGEIWEEIEAGADDADAMLGKLAAIRAETLDYLARAGEEGLENPTALAEQWQGYFGGATEIEPEELIRWITRHEYYHLGQMITYRWIMGYNPYQPA